MRFTINALILVPPSFLSNGELGEETIERGQRKPMEGSTEDKLGMKCLRLVTRCPRHGRGRAGWTNSG